MDAFTHEEAEALRHFAERHGRTWKAVLRDLWVSGKDANESDGSMLRQIRNRHGARGLDKFKVRS